MELAAVLPAAAGAADAEGAESTAEGALRAVDERVSAGEDRNLREWTPGRQRRALLDLLRAGKTDLEIGERFALSQWQVRNLRYRLGIKKDRGGRVRVRRDARRAGSLEREFVEAASRLAEADAPAPAAAVAAVDAERMGIRMGGRFEAVEAGRRLTALGGLLSASAGRFDIRVGVRQIDTAEPR